MTIELLAPAKNKEIAFAAINCGADAIYIGAQSFGARKNASNSLDDIAEIVNFAHIFWVKVFVTLNTILDDNELEEAVELAQKLDKIGVDAFIIQDLGLLKVLSESNLKAHFHMSTQCNNATLEQVSFFNSIGVSRVVLARETSLEQIKIIHEKNPNLELESFVHGALCVSYSGQCYLSQYIGGRSANRGECAQPCRKKYSVETTDHKVIKKDIYALCLKDFNASNRLQEMVNSGISSFKIEGRLKDANYVKNIVAFYDKKLGKENRASSGISKYSFISNPEKTFNRGFTEYFLTKREACHNFVSPKSRGEFLGKVTEIKNNCFKIKTNKQISAQDGLCFQDNGFLVNKFLDGYIYPNKNVNVKIGEKIFRNYDVKFEQELQQPIKRQISVSLEVNHNNIYIKDENGISAKLEINSKEKSNNQKKMRETFIKQLSKTGESNFYIVDIQINTELPFLPVSMINQLRRDLFEKLKQKRINFYMEKRIPQKQITYKPYFLQKVDYKANVHNREAVKFYSACNCKVEEFSLESFPPKRQIELMHCKYCIKYALNMCKSLENLILKDEYNNTYPLKFDCNKCEMKILSPQN